MTGTLTGGDLPGVDIEVSLSIVGLSLPPADPNGTATIAASAADFTADTPTLTILAGKPSATASLELTPVDHNLAEGNETAHVTGSRDLTVTPALLTIADNDQDPDGIRLSSNPTSVSEGDGPTSVEITAALVGGAARTAATAVELSVHDISAAAATDYSTGSAVTLTIPAGQMSPPATLTLTVVDDDIHEGTETVVVRGANEDPGLSVSGVRIGIEDNDAGPTGIALSLNKSIVAEERGPQQLTVTATLQGSMEPADRELRLTLAGGTAMTSDYTGLGGTLTIPAGVLEGTSNVVLSPNNDAIDEEDETLEVRGATPLSSLTVSHALVTITGDDTAGVNIRPTTLTVEEGASADYRVSLDTQPTGDVTVSVVVPANSGVAASPATLTFTDTDWNRSQTVSITGDQDDDAADEAPFTLTHTATSGGYSGVDVDSVSVTVTDDDTPEVLLSESSLSVEEGNTAGGTYTVKLSHPPTEEVTVTVTGQAGTDLTITGLSDSNTLTFTTTDWNTAQTVTVTAGQDDNAADDSVTLTHTAAGGEYAGTTKDLPVTGDDDETLGLVLSKSSLSVTEGATAGETYTVKLSHQPTVEVTVTVSGHTGTDLTLTGLSDSNTLTFTTTDWDTAQTVTVTAAQDDDAADDSITLAHTAAGGEYAGVPKDLPVTVDDDETLSVVLSKSSLSVTEGATTGETYTVKLSHQPTVEVTVMVSGHSGTGLTLTGLGTGDTLTFTTTGWDTAQTVTVTAGQDGDATDETVTLTHTAAGGEYAGVPKDLPVTVDDDETLSVVLNKSSLTVGEGDTTGQTYTVKLSHQPTVEVTVTVSGHSGTDLTLTGLGTGSTLTFTTTDCDTAQTATVKAGEDSDALNDAVTLTHTAAGGEYTDAAAELAITVDDDETLGLVLSEATLTVDEGDTTGETYTVKLSHQPTVEVTVTVPGHSGTDLTLTGLGAGSTLTFTTTTGDTAQTVTVKAGEDSDAGDDAVTLTHTAAGGEYTDAAAELAVTVDGDETLGLVLSESSLTVGEGDTTGDTYTVKLSHQPTVEVTVTVSGHSGTDLTLTGLGTANTLTFTTTDWDTAQTVTVKAAQDADAGNDSVTLTHTAAGGEYEGVTKDLPVKVDDDETLSVLLSKSSLTVDEGATAGGSYTVKLSHEPTVSVTVTVTGQAETDLTLTGLGTGSTLTFTTTDWDTAQTVTVKAAQDDDAADDSVTLTHTAAGGEYEGVTADLSVTVDDDDRNLQVVSASVSYDSAVYSVAEGDTTTVVARLSEALETEVIIPLTRTNEGGASDADYSGVPATLTFTAGDTEMSLDFSAAVDTEDEDGEQVVLSFGTLPEGVSEGAVSQATIAIRDAVLVSFGASEYSATEGEDDAVVTVQLSEALATDMTVPLTAEGGGGATPDDWSGAPEELTFSAGETSKTFTVVAVDDTVEDDGEMVKLGFGTLPAGLRTGSPDAATITLMNIEEVFTASCDGNDVWCATIGLESVVGDQLRGGPGTTLRDG